MSNNLIIHKKAIAVGSFLILFYNFYWHNKLVMRLKMVKCNFESNPKKNSAYITDYNKFYIFGLPKWS